MCVICQQNLVQENGDEVQMPACGHAFHRPCLEDTWEIGREADLFQVSTLTWSNGLLLSQGAPCVRRLLQGALDEAAPDGRMDGARQGEPPPVLGGTWGRGAGLELAYGRGPHKKKSNKTSQALGIRAWPSALNSSSKISLLT